MCTRLSIIAVPEPQPLPSEYRGRVRGHIPFEVKAVKVALHSWRGNAMSTTERAQGAGFIATTNIESSVLAISR